MTAEHNTMTTLVTPRSVTRRLPALIAWAYGARELVDPGHVRMSNYVPGGRALPRIRP
jgi:hypothetical protein